VSYGLQLPAALMKENLLVTDPTRSDEAGGAEGSDWSGRPAAQTHGSWEEAPPEDPESRLFMLLELHNDGY